MTQLLNWITYQILNGLKIIEKTKWEGASNRLREKTAPGNSGGRELCSNLWTVRGTLLQTILDNWTVFQDLWDDILEGKVNSGIRGQAIRVQTKSKVSFFFFFITTWSFFYNYRQPIFHSAIHTRHVKKVSELQSHVFQH